VLARELDQGIDRLRGSALPAVRRNPFEEQVKRQRRSRGRAQARALFFTFDEAKRLVAAADGEWQTMILVALRTGMRIGELLALQWRDVDLVAGRITVRRNVVWGVTSVPRSRVTRARSLCPTTPRRR
jgi:integrase